MGPEGQALHNINTKILEDSKLKELPWGLQELPALIFPQPKPPTNPSWMEQCCKCIEDCGELLSKPFTSVSDTILQSLEDTEQTCGGQKYILAELECIAHNAFVQHASGVIEGNDMDKECKAD